MEAITQAKALRFKAGYIRHDFAHLPREVAELELDPRRLAFIMVDMQNDFAGHGGIFDVKGVPMEGPRQVIEPCRRLAAACRRRGVQVVYSQHQFRPDLSDMGPAWASVFRDRPGSTPPGSAVGPPGEKLGVQIRGCWNAAIVPELTPQPGDIVIDNKHKYTAFYQTDLEGILRNLGIEWLLFAGLSTCICVESTLRDAFHRDFQCMLLSDCTWERTPELQAASETLVMLHFGYVTASGEVIRALKGG